MDFFHINQAIQIIQIFQKIKLNYNRMFIHILLFVSTTFLILRETTVTCSIVDPQILNNLLQSLNSSPRQANLPIISKTPQQSNNGFTLNENPLNLVLTSHYPSNLVVDPSPLKYLFSSSQNIEQSSIAIKEKIKNQNCHVLFNSKEEQNTLNNQSATTQKVYANAVDISNLLNFDSKQYSYPVQNSDNNLKNINNQGQIKLTTSPVLANLDQMLLKSPFVLQSQKGAIPRIANKTITVTKQVIKYPEMVISLPKQSNNAYSIQVTPNSQVRPVQNQHQNNQAISSIIKELFPNAILVKPNQNSKASMQQKQYEYVQLPDGRTAIIIDSPGQFIDSQQLFDNRINMPTNKTSSVINSPSDNRSQQAESNNLKRNKLATTIQSNNKINLNKYFSSYL